MMFLGINFDMWVPNLRSCLEMRSTLYTFILCGIAGVLVDFDHVLKFFLFPTQDWRFLHTSLLLIGCSALCCCGAYIGGLYFGCVLKRKGSELSSGEEKGQR